MIVEKNLIAASKTKTDPIENCETEESGSELKLPTKPKTDMRKVNVVATIAYAFAVDRKFGLVIQTAEADSAITIERMNMRDWAQVIDSPYF